IVVSPSTQTQILHFPQPVPVGGGPIFDEPFQLSLAGQTTTGLDLFATAADIQGALASLPIVSAGGSVAVTQISNDASGITFAITFGGSLTQANLPLITSNVPDVFARPAGSPVISGVDVTLVAGTLTLNAGITATDAIALAPDSPAAVTLGDGVAGASFAL